MVLGLLLLLGIFSCTSGDSQDFIVENNTNQVIDSIFILSSDSLATTDTIQIKPTTTAKLNLNLKKAKPSDGHYIIRFIKEEKSFVYPFGYYTNAKALDDLIKLSITKDSVLINY